jgi:hypothetical protein
VHVGRPMKGHDAIVSGGEAESIARADLFYASPQKFVKAKRNLWKSGAIFMKFGRAAAIRCKDAWLISRFLNRNDKMY